MIGWARDADGGQVALLHVGDGLFIGEDPFAGTGLTVVEAQGDGPL